MADEPSITKPSSDFENAKQHTEGSGTNLKSELDPQEQITTDNKESETEKPRLEEVKEFENQPIDEERDNTENEPTTETPLMTKDDAVNIEVPEEEEGDNTATLPIRKQKSKEGIDPSCIEYKRKAPKYLFPLTRMKIAWAKSSNICDFICRAVVIIFSTLGWMFCVGGVPFVSLAMLIIGSIYLDDCKVQPHIPTYLIVAGTLGTLQHIIAIWTKYIPRDAQGRIGVYRAYCSVTDGILSVFLAIWFVCGCIWIYGVQEVEFRDTEKQEYCNKTLYYFAFWLMNFSFIILAVLVVLSLCCILCVVSLPKDNKETVQ